jgi:hypothetical protein
MVTSTFAFGKKTVSEYNPRDGGWTTTKTTDQSSGSTTTTIAKTNPDGSISTKNPNDNIITTKIMMALGLLHIFRHKLVQLRRIILMVEPQ